MKLINLPPEILLEILKPLDIESVKSCSRACWQLRYLTVRVLFSNIYVHWDTISDFLDQKDNDHILNSVETLLINTSSGYGEWHGTECLVNCINRCLRLTSLDLVISGSSSWIKYLSPTVQVPKITRAHITSQIVKDRSKFTDNSGLELPLFDVGDLARSFPLIQDLHLHGFHVRNDNDSQTVLQSLELIDCTWDYPFNMDVGGTLEKLKLKYTRSFASFTHAERLKTLVVTDPPPTLKSLVLEFDVGHMTKSWLPKCPVSLQELELQGFDPPHAPADFFKNLPQTMRRLRLELLESHQWRKYDIYKHCRDNIVLELPVRLEKPGITRVDLK